MPGHSVEVLHQHNTSDCGIFVLQYVEQFFKVFSIFCLIFFYRRNFFNVQKKLTLRRKKNAYFFLFFSSIKKITGSNKRLWGAHQKIEQLVWYIRCARKTQRNCRSHPTKNDLNWFSDARWFAKTQISQSTHIAALILIYLICLHAKRKHIAEQNTLKFVETFWFQSVLLTLRKCSLSFWKCIKQY